MRAMASQITSVSIVGSTHQSSGWLAYVRGIPRSPMNSPHKGQITRKMFPFNDVVMWYEIRIYLIVYTSCCCAVFCCGYLIRSSQLFWFFLAEIFGVVLQAMGWLSLCRRSYTEGYVCMIPEATHLSLSQFWCGKTPNHLINTWPSHAQNECTVDAQHIPNHTGTLCPTNCLRPTESIPKITDIVPWLIEWLTSRLHLQFPCPVVSEMGHLIQYAIREVRLLWGNANCLSKIQHC